MAMKAADYSDVFGSEDFSDVNILVYEEAEEDGSSSPQQAGKRPRGAEQVLPGHKLVLRALSLYFKTKVDKWSKHQPAADAAAARSSKAARTNMDQDAATAADQQQQPNSKPQIKLPVPVAQLPVGRLLLKSMYEAQPDLSAVDQVQLVQLIVLADRYEVPKVAIAAAAAIRKLPTDQLQWETVFTVTSMPSGCAEMEACPNLSAASAAKVQQELGDLELDWADTKKKKVLLQLPFPLLQGLLSDNSTRVASVDTVLYTLERWCAWQQQHMPPAQQPTDAQLRQLVALVRMSYCSSAYVTTIFAAGTAAERALQRSELAQAGVVAGSGIAAPNAMHRQFSSACPWASPVLQTFPKWATYRRPLTQRGTRLVFTFTPEQLESLYHKVETAMAAAEGLYLAIMYHDFEPCFQGSRFAVGVVFRGIANAPGRHFKLGLAVKLVGFPAEAVLPCSYTLWASGHTRSQEISAVSERSNEAYISVLALCTSGAPVDSLASFKRFGSAIGAGQSPMAVWSCSASKSRIQVTLLTLTQPWHDTTIPTGLLSVSALLQQQQQVTLMCTRVMQTVVFVPAFALVVQ